MIILPMPALALQPVVLSNEQGEYPLGLFLEYLEDPTGTLTIEEVSSSEYDERFIPSQKKNLRFGFTASAYWVRFQVTNRSSSDRQWLLEYAYPLAYRLELYVSAEQNNIFLHTQTGRKYPFAHRAYPYETFVFPLSLPQHKSTYIYLCAQNKFGLPIPLTFWSPEAFHRHARRRRFSQGVLLGLIAIMFCYHGFLFMAIRERAYGYYALFLFSLIISNLFITGLAEQYLPLLAAQNVTPLFSLFAYMALLKFCQSFLETASYFPTWNRGIHALLFGWSALAAIFFLYRLQKQESLRFMAFMGMAFACIFLTYASILILAGMTWHKGYRPARYFFFAVLLNFLPQGMWILNFSFGLHLPQLSLQRGSNVFGHTFLILFLSFALADRINLLKQEKERAHRRLQEHQEHLEELVEARTHELRQTLDSLHDSQHELTELNQHLEERVQEEFGKRRQQERLLIQKSKLESLGSLSAGIAHEINQPLTRIGINAESLLLKVIDQEPISSEYLEKRCQIIQDSMARITQIIDHIRTFSRYQQSLQLEHIDINTTIMNALLFIRTQYQHHNIIIKTDLQAKGQVLGNQYKLEQVLLNVLSNARDALETTPQSIEGVFRQKLITIRTYHEDDNVMITIEDTGIGIPEEEKEAIFDPFFTTKEVGKGTGLGLSVSYGIIKDMDGDMTVESQVNEGTTMKIILPRQSAMRRIE